MSGSSKAKTNASADQPSNPNAIGAGIKRYRQKRKWPLKTLSERSGVPVSTLSKVENGQMSLKLEKLLRVSDALEIDIMQLVSPAEPEAPVSLVTGRRCITRRGQAPVSETENTVYEHHAHDFSHRKLSPMIIDLQPGRDPELVRHQGEEFIYVLEGRVEALTEFYEPTVLETGDSLYIDSSMAHNVRALDGKPARVLNVSSVPRNPAS